MPTIVSSPTQPGRSLHRSPCDSIAAAISSEPYPRLHTPRFRFRPFSPADIAPFAALAGEHRIADTTIGIPHPYTAEFARMWIASHSEAWKARRALHWAAHKAGENRILGYAGLHNIDLQSKQAELRFWVGCGVRRHEDAVEWSRAVMEFARVELGLTRVYAMQLERHPPAARVLSTIGMRQEGLVRKRVLKGGLVENIVCWAILQKDC